MEKALAETAALPVLQKKVNFLWKVKFVQESGAQTVIPPRSNRINPREFDHHIYKERHLIECFFNKIKHYRRVFARYEKTARNFMAFLYFVAFLIWTR